MLQKEDKLSLTRLVDALPAWMEEGQAAKVLLEQSAEREFITFVRVPQRTVVIEQAPLFPLSSAKSFGAMDEPMISVPMRMEKNRGGDVIDRPVAKPLIRLLELEPADLKDMATTGYVRRHWFRSRGISTDSNESLGLVLEPKTLRCIRPAFKADSETNQVAPRLSSAIGFDERFDYTFTANDVCLSSSDAQVLRYVIFRPENSDPHRLFDSAPAVYHLYSAAKKYTGQLENLPRGQSPTDKKRLDALTQEVFKHLAKFGKPFDTKTAREQAFKFIDPHFPWGKGAPRKPFSEVAKTITSFDDEYAYENFVTDGLGLIFYITRLAVSQRVKLREEGGMRGLSNGEVRAHLEKHNFSGNDELSTLAAIVRWQGPKPERKTASVKKP